ncbi:MAG: LLM class flavin-dependent oxidoreductase [Candidatus Eremiobacteraeota bacterium]|nr:LLM class flavin-dependent oxidoreductase [Candidatus Eremiobacteraeota bacterium]
MSNLPTFGVWYDFRQSLPFDIPYRQFYREVLDEVVHAEQLGFTHCWTSEHHFVDDGYQPSQLVALAAIAGRTQKMQLGTNVLLLPLYHPLRVAEDAAVLDLVSGGRFTLGVGAGYVEFEFEALGVNRKQRPSLMEEGVKIIRQAWDRGNIGFQGERWQLPELPFSPQPERHIPILFGANAPSALRRAVRLGDGFVTGSSAAGLKAVREQYAVLQDEMQAQGKTPETFPYTFSTWMHLGDSSEAAWNEVAEGVAYQLNRYADWGTDRDQPRPKKLTAKDLQRENFPFIGHPEEVAQAMVDLHKDIPYVHFCYWGRTPGLNTRQVLKNQERFQSQVVPPVQKALAQQ